MKVGTMVGERFEIERFIARGGMGDVYQAYDHQTGDDVALKVIAQEPRLVKRLALEARALLELSHPAIVGYVAHGLTDGDGLYLAMEYLDGQTLSARLKQQPLTVEQALQLGARVAEGLGAAHGQGMVHRDVKPLNLFLPNNQVDRVKVLDFGIVRLSQFQRITATGVGMGTPEYMAPEQARGEKEVGPQADVFALGCVLFKCLTGRTAFPGKRIDAVLAKIAMVEQPPRITEINPDLPAPVDHLVAKMMAHKAADRPKDGDAAAAHIHAVISALRVGIEPTAQVRPAPSLTKKDLQPLSVILAELESGDADTIPSALVVDTPEFEYPAEHSEVGPPPRPPSADGGATVEQSGEEQLRVFHGASDVARLLPSLRRALEPYGARVEILLNGSLVAVLSGGVAAKDLAARSARCALTIREMLSDASIGVATKRAIKGDRKSVVPIIDSAASLLQRRSRVIRIDKNTRDLLSPRFEVARSGGRAFVLVDELAHEPKPDEPPRLLLGKETPCVGRNRLLRQLEAIFVGCVEDRASEAVVIVGDSGVGKTRVVGELVRRLQASENLAVAAGRGDILRAKAPYDLVGRAVRRFLDIPEGEPEIRRNELRARVARLIDEDERERVTEFLGELIGVPFPPDDSPALRAAHLDAKLMTDQKRRAWIDWLRAECEQTPVLFIVDDAHWADQLSMELIGHALKQLAEAPFLVLASARPEIHDQFPKLADDWNRQEIQLDTLRPADCDALVRDVLGDDVDEATRRRLVERSAGNAFYLEELIRASAGGDTDALPESVLASVQLRVAALPDGARQVLRAASIFGRNFWSGGIVALLGLDTTPEEVSDWLDALEGAELIERADESALPGQNEYRFRHDITREAVYHMLTDADRITGHRLAGDWLQDHGEAEPVVLAEHFAGGGAADKAVALFERAAREALSTSSERGQGAEPRSADDSLEALRKAAKYFRRAGEASMAAYANLNAVDFFERAVAFWAMLDPAEAVRTQLELVDVWDRLGESARALKELSRAEHDASRTEHPEELNIEILIKTAWIEARGQAEGTLNRARKLAHRARELASQLGERALEAKAATTLAVILSEYDTEETSRKAIYYAEQALVLQQELGEVSTSLWRLGNVFLYRNELDRAASLYEQAIEGAQARQNDVLLAGCLANLGLISFRRWHLDDAIAKASRALKLYRRIGDQRRTTASTANLGTYYRVRGDTLAARPLLEEAVEGSKGDWIFTSLSNESLAYLARHEGDEFAAQQILSETAALCERAGVPQKQALYLGLLAESYWMTGAPEQAIRCLTTALEVAEGVTLSHALLMVRMGNYEDGREWLEGFRREEPDPERRVHAVLALARLCSWQGDVPQAKRLCEEALQTVAPSNAPAQTVSARVLQACLAGDTVAAIQLLVEAQQHCPKYLFGDVQLDVATLVGENAERADDPLKRRMLRLTENAEDAGIRFRIESLRASVLEQLGSTDEASLALERSIACANEIRTRLPEEYWPLFDEHPWVCHLRALRSV